ncbi:Pvc16 family protein [Enterobacter sp. ECC-175]|uniref:Pvc16 family protein n=1 Tax=unclassified Enterobacter TaxID=2608935 RepID=UPI000D4E42F0|nr:Pvc16 family protein [Enterobacter sp. RIT 418]RAU29876.1 hypothetical protein DBY73_021520 [Enterobacter sp. RIT 418]
MFNLKTFAEQATEIARVNQLIKEHVEKYVKPIVNVDVRFDEPDPDSPPTKPTFHFFMYLVHEDLAIRHSLSRQYDPASGQFSPEEANIRCLYLATYWEGTTKGGSDSPKAAYNSQSIICMTEMVRALLCMRKSQAFKSYQLRVIEPEALNSLGNFWQALGNKPRGIINFAVTLPMNIACQAAEVVVPVGQIQLVARPQKGDALAYLEAILHDTLNVLPDLKKGPAKIAIAVTVCEEGEVFTPVTLQISGIVPSNTAKKAIEDEVARWQNDAVEFVASDMRYCIADSQCSLVLPWPLND